MRNSRYVFPFLALSLAAPALFATVGCAAEGPDTWASVGGLNEVAASEFEGTIVGSAPALHDSIYLEEGWAGDGLVIFEVRAFDPTHRSATMAQLSVYGLDRLAVGEELTTVLDDPSRGYDEADVTLLGCSGQEPDNYDADELADEVTVRVEEGETPEQAELFYTARWNDGSVVRGSMTYRPSEVAAAL